MRLLKSDGLKNSFLRFINISDRLVYLEVLNDFFRENSIEIERIEVAAQRDIRSGLENKALYSNKNYTLQPASSEAGAYIKALNLIVSNKIYKSFIGNQEDNLSVISYSQLKDDLMGKKLHHNLKKKSVYTTDYRSRSMELNYKDHAKNNIQKMYVGVYNFFEEIENNRDTLKQFAVGARYVQLLDKYKEKMPSNIEMRLAKDYLEESFKHFGR
jgi:hypothetical protein